MNATTIYILGAGCSVKYGYPLAAGFIPELESFSRTLDGDSPKLKRCVDETVALLRHENVQTLDDLTFRIHNRALDDQRQPSTQAYGVRSRRILNAKIATAALFLHLEQAAKAKVLDSYQRLILKLFPGSSDWRQRFRNTNCRLLTFNYDRLFELALLKMFRIEQHEGLLYGEDILNSGLNSNTGRGLGFASDRFCFVKLHGSIGVRVREEAGGPRYYPYLDGSRPGEVLNINDERFFANADNSNPYERDPAPLIVFPFEKDFVLSGSQNQLVFREYISRVWQQAEHVITTATEIRFVGYSFHPMDHVAVLGLLKKAQSCSKLVIQNRHGEAERICRTLQVDHGIKIPLQPYGCDF
ncbi:MAG: hypothetical protein WCO56_23940 [Verrucomicrobiota bacterium]